MKRLGQPKRYTFEEREEKVREAALGLFSSHGFKGTTTKAIAQKAGINEALLFRHYSTKEDLYSAILKNLFSRRESDLRPLLPQMLKEPLDKALFRISKTIIGQQRAEPRLFRTMLYAALENRKLGPLFFKQRLPIRSLLVEFFGKKMAEGKIKKDDPLILTRGFMAMIFHYLLVTEIFKAKGYYPKEEDETLKSSIRLFEQGVKR